MIGDIWAANIAKAFVEWAEKVEIDGRSNIPVTRFDPTPLIEAAYYAGGEDQLVKLGRILGIGVKFDLRSPEAEAWIKQYGAQQIKYIDSTTRATIRQIILRGQQEGLTIAEQSKLIKKYIGLLPHHAIAVEKYRDMLSDLDPNVRERLVERYRKRLLKWRADTIGLTEAHTACNEGARKTNADAVARGILDPDEYEREWLVTPDHRLCDTCMALSGRRAPLPDGVFPGDGRGPPKHPRCRCVERIVRKR